MEVNGLLDAARALWAPPPLIYVMTRWRGLKCVAARLDSDIDVYALSGELARSLDHHHILRFGRPMPHPAQVVEGTSLTVPNPDRFTSIMLGGDLPAHSIPSLVLREPAE